MSRQSGCFGPLERSENDQSKFTLRFEVTKFSVIIHKPDLSVLTAQSSFYLTSLWAHLYHDSAFQAESNTRNKWTLIEASSHIYDICNLLSPDRPFLALSTAAGKWWVMMWQRCEDAKWEKKHMNSVPTAHKAVTSAGMRYSMYLSLDHLWKWKEFSESNVESMVHLFVMNSSVRH